MYQPHLHLELMRAEHDLALRQAERLAHLTRGDHPVPSSLLASARRRRIWLGWRMPRLRPFVVRRLRSGGVQQGGGDAAGPAAKGESASVASTSDRRNHAWRHAHSTVGDHDGTVAHAASIHDLPSTA